MARNFNTTKLAALAKSLTGKEAAFLVIDYQIRSEKEKRDYSNEIKTIVSSINYNDLHKRQEYIFYHDMWRNCGFYSMDLQTSLMHLEIYAWKLEAINQLMFDNSFKYLFSRFMNTLPKYLNQEQFNDLYLKCRDKMFAEHLPLESVAEYEAFKRLEKEGLIAEDKYYVVADIFCANEELKNIFEKYVGDIKNELEKAIKNGLLQEGKVIDKIGWYHSGDKYIGQRAITGKSWYNYNKKFDNSYNKFIDNKGKLTEFYEGELAIAQGSASQVSSKNKNICWAESQRRDMIESLQEGLSVNLTDKEIYFDKLFDPMLQTLVEWTNNCIQTAINHSEVLKKVQRDVFNGKFEFGISLMDKSQESIDKPKEVMDSLIVHLKHIFKIFCLEDKPKIKNEDRYKIVTEIKPDEAFVKEHFELLIDLAERESGYRWKK